MLPHINRREFLASAAGFLAAGSAAAARAPKKIAAAVTVYHHNSHADVIVGRLLEGYNLNGRGDRPNLELVSLYVEQLPKGDLSRGLARKHGFTLAPTIADALTLGGKDLAVDGVILVGEHGQYKVNAKGQTLYPRRRFFEETVKVIRRSHRVVPVFSDKHLSAAWSDAKWMHDTARELRIPLMAGSSIPLTWRKPPLDTPAGGSISDLTAISYHTLDAYGFHALEMVQCLAERRRGGETGVAAVRCVVGPEVWRLGTKGGYDRRLLDTALARREQKGRFQGRIEDAAKEPVLFLVEYRDGLKAAVFTLNNAVGEWAAAWREKGRAAPRATLFWTQEQRPFGHFSFLVKGIERMMLTGKPTWPVQRTLLTTGLLDALLTSKHNKGERVPTPHLAIAYKPAYSWKAPPPPPPGRPLNEQ
ncbi:MAG TPA: hypothetical protein VG013_19880 [Gemmataceae bacterium]|jgi:hypothetical protein|nr:hypothetical protein [Gemmataceae bacterium]